MSVLEVTAPLVVGRVEALADPGSLDVALGDGVLTGRCVIAGVRAWVYATDPAVRGGALGYDGCLAIEAAIDAAAAEGAPVVGLWHSGGARLQEGVASLDGVGRVFAAMVRASGVVPQVSVVLGPCAGGAAYGPALTDFVVLAPEGRVFVTGPDVVRSVTGESVDMERLVGPDVHGRRSGVAHVVAASEADALATARDLVALLGRPGSFGPVADRDLGALLPESGRRAYDVRPLVAQLLDDGGVELQPAWAPNVTTTLGRLAGRTVGVVANNPLRLGGCLDSSSAEKAARFVRACDAFGVPLVVLVDVPGYLPGAGQEWDGVVRRGAKLLHAFAACAVPRVTVVTRKAYGGAYIAMNARSLGATTVYAWPGAEVDVMGAEAAVGILHRRRLAEVGSEAERAALVAELAEEHRAIAGGVRRALELGAVDAVVVPERTRSAVAAALAGAPARRGRPGNTPL